MFPSPDKIQAASKIPLLLGFLGFILGAYLVFYTGNGSGNSFFQSMSYLQTLGVGMFVSSLLTLSSVSVQFYDNGHFSTADSEMMDTNGSFAIGSTVANSILTGFAILAIASQFLPIPGFGSSSGGGGGRGGLGLFE
jgi:hypothetical protein